MARTIARDGPFRLDFDSKQEPRTHLHVAYPDGEAKFSFIPTVDLAVNLGLFGMQLRLAQASVESHLQEIRDAWHRHVGG